MAHTNIEIKARSSNNDTLRKTLKLLGADFKGTDYQVDTYFAVRNGRLKLREGNIENFLIYYKREDKDEPKQSDVRLYKTSKDPEIRKMLADSIGILAVVDKRREIYFIGNIKFHLDMVEGLGEFVEIEAIDKEGNIGKEKLLEQCKYYMELFKINNSDLMTGSYSDMILSKRQ